MPSPLATPSGNGNLLVTSTVPEALASGAEQKVDVALGLPALDAIQDIANAFQVRNLFNANQRLQYKLTAGGSDLDLSLSFLQQGVNEGDSIVLANV